MLYNYCQLGPKKIFGLGTKNLVHHGDTNKKYFVALGDSFTTGVEINYNDSWPYKLGQFLELEHVNLGFAGSSIDYSNIVLKKSLEINQNVLHVYMLTYPQRSHRTSVWRSDKSKRIMYSRMDDKQCIEKIISTVDQYKDYKNIIFTNVWGYPTNHLLALKSVIKKFNFCGNLSEMIDYGNDNLHAGPKSHTEIAIKLNNYIKNNFYAKY